MVGQGWIPVTVHLHPAQLGSLAGGRKEEEEEEQEAGHSHVQSSQHSWTTHPFFLFMIRNSLQLGFILHLMLSVLSLSETFTRELERQWRLI